jgi:hypothetical protein
MAGILQCHTLKRLVLAVVAGTTVLPNRSPSAGVHMRVMSPLRAPHGMAGNPQPMYQAAGIKT